MDKPVAIDFAFISSWNRFFIYHQWLLIKKIATYKKIPVYDLIKHLPTENEWEQKLPISPECHEDRCKARIYGEGYGGRCEHVVSNGGLCKSHYREKTERGRCKYGKVC